MNKLTFDKSGAFTRAIEALVPGGAHTYSKGRDQFPAEAPNGITHGKGARVWDADGNCLVDWSMGLTSVSLGHAYPSVNEAVCDAIANGVNFQRPAALELEAAWAFLDLTGTDMVKFARHGSSVTTAAVKLARAFTGRGKVAFPREHPFFSFDDWFIGTTECDFGVPEAIRQYSLVFSYNSIESLQELFRREGDDIACVIMEPAKFSAPKDGFLQEVGALCRSRGALLILDEMVSGLKFAVPGAARYFGVEADLYTYGKGIANGFSCAAVTGRGDVMRLGGLEPEGARKLFLLSTTHGAESVGLAAMMATIAEFRDGEIIRQNWEKGERLRSRLNAVAERHGVSGRVRIDGYPCMMAATTLGPDGAPNDEFRTLFLQEMISHGALFQGLFFLTPSHGEDEFSITEAAFDAACQTYAVALEQGDVGGLLVGPATKPVFRKVL